LQQQDAAHDILPPDRNPVIGGARAAMPGWPMQGMKCLVLLGGVLFPGMTQADIVECSFTEPFIATSYDTSSQRMTVTYDVEKRRTIFDRISMREVRRGVFEFRNADGQVLQSMRRTCQGSDGMSDVVYPYEGEWIVRKCLRRGQRSVTPPDPRRACQLGGCKSTRPTKC
jgi:hypothetical protein